jgi:hypothetical protein
MHIWTTIERTDEDGDPVEHEVKVEFTAYCTCPASKACWDDPGWDAEYECSFESAEFDREPEGGKLTDAELATLRTWFVHNHDKASDAANDNAVGEL